MIRTIIACGIVSPMGTPANASPKKNTPSRKPLNMRTVVNEMLFLDSLHTDSPNDDRIPELVRDLKADFAAAVKKFPGGDDLPPIQNPLPPG
jgi:hypothetical protein